MTSTPVSRLRDLSNSFREGLRRRRAARAAYLDLERQLATYRTPREVDDLLGSISGQDEPESEQIREILMNNLRPTRELYRVS